MKAKKGKSKRKTAARAATNTMRAGSQTSRWMKRIGKV